MNIERTLSPIQTSSPIKPEVARQPQPDAGPKDSFSYSSDGVTVEVIDLRKSSSNNKLARHATKVLSGAFEGLAIGLMSKGMGPLGATFANGAISGVAGGVRGHAFGKELGQKLESVELGSKLKRDFATSGALEGVSDGLMRGGLVAGVTALTGGNLAVGMATGVALNYLL